MQYNLFSSISDFYGSLVVDSLSYFRECIIWTRVQFWHDGTNSQE